MLVDSLQIVNGGLGMLTAQYDIESMGKISNYKKGFYFEMNVQTLLDKHNISYEGNPITFDEWKRYTKTGHDIKILELHVRVECKYLSKPIYESWFRRDWSSRDADIYVTTDPHLVPYQCRRELASRGKLLLTPHQFIAHILKLLKGNKSIDLNIRLYGLIIVLFCLLNGFEYWNEIEQDRNRFRTRLNWLFKDILHRSHSTGLRIIVCFSWFPTRLDSIQSNQVVSVHVFQPGCFPTKLVFPM